MFGSCVYRGKGIRISAGGLAAAGLAGAVMAGVQSLLLVCENRSRCMCESLVYVRRSWCRKSRRMIVESMGGLLPVLLFLELHTAVSQ